MATTKKREGFLNNCSKIFYMHGYISEACNLIKESQKLLPLQEQLVIEQETWIRIKEQIDRMDTTN